LAVIVVDSALTLHAVNPASPEGKRRDSWRLDTSKDVLGQQRRPTDALDRFIIAAARVLSLPLISKDKEVTAAGIVEVVW